jgi:hypothetical protein
MSQKLDTTPQVRATIINQASRDSSSNYCFVYNLLHSQSNYRDCERACGGGCKGKGWCTLRQTLYESPMKGRSISQTTLMTRALYLESEIEGEDISLKLPAFWTEDGGGSDRFHEQWDEGVHLPDTLEPLCVTPSLHNSPVHA